jgi:hypothetical protein
MAQIETSDYRVYIIMDNWNVLTDDCPIYYAKYIRYVLTEKKRFKT